MNRQPRHGGSTPPPLVLGSGAVRGLQPVTGPEGPDLRLVGPALGAWLTSLWALYVSATLAAGVALAAALLAVLLWCVRRRVRRGEPGSTSRVDRRTAVLTTIAIGVLLGIVSGAVATAARTAARDAEPLAGLARKGATVRAELTITDDPRRSRAAAARSWLVEARLTRLRTRVDRAWLALDVRVLVIGTDQRWRRLLPGQRTRVTGRLTAARAGDLRAAVLAVSQAPELRGGAPAVQRAAGSLRAGLREAAEPLPDRPGGLLPGLAIGDVSRMDPAVEEDFRATGMTHLTAVSGSNVAIVCGLVLLLAGWCRAGPRTAAGVSLLALAGFVILVRPSPSVLRAAVMGALALFALASSRPRAAIPGLAASVYLLVLLDPELASDAGFALSVLATAGLLLLAPRWRDALRRRGVPAGVAEALAVPVAAQVACAPVIAAMTGTVSLAAIPANLLATPAVAPATVLGASAAAVSPVSPQTAQFLAWLGGWPARWLVWVADWGAGLPAGTAAWPGGIVGGLLLASALALLLVLTRHTATRRILAVAAVAVLLGAGATRTVLPGWPPPGWVLVACDVGQGDALVLRTGTGQAIVVDTGPEPAAVDRCLHRLGIVDVPLLALTHFHVDHIGGLAGALRDRAVTAVAVPTYAEPAPGRRAVARTVAGGRIPLLAVGAGWKYRIGEVRLEVLGPEKTQLGTRSDANNNSVIVRITVSGVSMLLAGDAEIERQQALLASGATVRADVLKVAHHGSAYQDPEFLDAVDPQVAIVSVGVGNEYGHPNPSVLRRLVVGGARVLRTDRSGDLAVVAITPDGLAVTERGRQPGRRPT